MGLPFAFDRWRPRHLLAAWAAYWAALAVATLAPAAPFLWRVTHLADGAGSVGAGIADGHATLQVLESGRVLWSGTVGTGAMLAAVAVPPLVLWALWVVRRARHADPDAAVGTADASALPPGAFDLPAKPRPYTPPHVDRVRRDRGD